MDDTVLSSPAFCESPVERGGGGGRAALFIPFMMSEVMSSIRSLTFLSRSGTAVRVSSLFMRSLSQSNEDGGNGRDLKRIYFYGVFGITQFCIAIILEKQGSWKPWRF